MRTGCPSELALERFVRAPEQSPLAPHVAACPDCTARLGQMDRDGRAFDARVYPATVEAVMARVAPRRSPLRWLWLAPIPAFAAVALLVVRPVETPRAPADYVGRRRSDLILSVFTPAPDGPRRVKTGDRVAADAQLRFEVDSAKPCWLTIVSVDRDARISKLFPADANSREIRKAGPLPGAPKLDGIAGPERVYALCAPKPLSFERVAGIVQGSGVESADSLRRSAGLTGLTDGTEQATVLLEKHR